MQVPRPPAGLKQGNCMFHKLPHWWEQVVPLNHTQRKLGLVGARRPTGRPRRPRLIRCFRSQDQRTQHGSSHDVQTPHPLSSLSMAHDQMREMGNKELGPKFRVRPHLLLKAPEQSRNSSFESRIPGPRCASNPRVLGKVNPPCWWLGSLVPKKGDPRTQRSVPSSHSPVLQQDSQPLFPSDYNHLLGPSSTVPTIHRSQPAGHRRAKSLSIRDGECLDHCLDLRTKSPKRAKTGDVVMSICMTMTTL